MSHDHHADLGKHVKIYMLIFAALIVGTVITVAVTKVHFSIPMAIFVALVVATVKGSLVAAYFMHLIGERPFITRVLLLTAVFFVAMMGLILWAYADQAHHGDHGAFSVKPAPKAVETHGEHH